MVLFMVIIHRYYDNNDCYHHLLYRHVMIITITIKITMTMTIIITIMKAFSALKTQTHNQPLTSRHR